MSATSLLLSAGLVLALAWAWRERTLRRNLERDGADTHARREAMQRSLEHLAEGVALLGSDDEVVYANPAAAALLDAPDAAGLPAAAAAPQGVPFERFTPQDTVRRFVALTPAGATVRRVLEIERPGDLADLVVQATLAPAGPGPVADRRTRSGHAHPPTGAPPDRPGAPPPRARAQPDVVAAWSLPHASKPPFEHPVPV